MSEKEEGGFLPFLYTAYKMIPVRKDYSSRVKNILSQYGDKPIRKIVIMRTPLQKFINVALNITTLGQWQKAVSNYGYDNMYHLYCIVFLDGGVQIKVEKNEIINIELVPGDISYVAGQYLWLSQPIPSGITLNQMLQRTRDKMGEGLYWNYSAFAPNNCQTFITYFLDSNGLLTDVEKNFIDQNVQNMAKGAIFKPIKAISDVVTGLASRFRTLTGTGLDVV
jgi:hypothetical protein